MRLVQFIMICLVIATALLVANLALANENKIIGEFKVESDSNNNDIQKIMFGYGRDVDNWRYRLLQGVENVSDLDATRTMNITELRFENLDKGTKYNGFVNTAYGHSWTTLGAGLDVYHNISKNANMGLSFERNFVKSRKAIDSEITFNSFGISGNYTIADITLAGSFTTQPFSDGNTRTIAKARAIVPFKNGFRGEILLKDTSNTHNPVEYFTPRSMRERYIGLGYKKWYYNKKLYVNARYLIGSQTISSSANASKTFLELRNTVNKNTHIKFVYDELDVLGKYPYNWQSYSIKLEYTF